MDHLAPMALLSGANGSPYDPMAIWSVAPMTIVLIAIGDHPLAPMVIAIGSNGSILMATLDPLDGDTQF